MSKVEIDRNTLKVLLACAEQHVEDVETGIEEGLYIKSENIDLQSKLAACAAAAALVAGSDIPEIVKARELAKVQERKMEMDEYKTLVARCAEQGRSLAQQMASSCTLEPLYLYFRPSQPGKSGVLYLIRDSAPVPPGVQLATGEGLRTNVPYDTYFQWVFDRSKRLPLLAY